MRTDNKDNLVVIIDNFFLNSNSKDNYLSHGTLCYHYFKLWSSNAIIKKISLLENINKDITCDALCNALMKALSYKPIMVVMSVGTTNINYSKKIYSIVKLYEKSNIPLVCATSNKRKITFPASFREVIGVSWDSNSIYSGIKSLSNDSQFLLIENPIDGVDIISFMPRKTDDYDDLVNWSNSLAAQFFAAKFFNFLCHLETKIFYKEALKLFCNANSVDRNILPISEDIQNIGCHVKNDDIISIAFMSNARYPTNFLIELKEIFAEHGFSASIIANDIDEKIFEYEFSYFGIRQMNNADSFDFSFIYSIVDADIMLIYLPGTIYQKTFCDLVINIDDYYVNCDSLNKPIIKGQIDVIQLYNHIFNNFA